MGIEIAIAAGKVVFLLLLLVLQVVGMGVFFERKVSAVIQDRIGANRASIFGFAGLGIINTLVADPVKFLLKEDVVPAGVDHRLHFWAPIVGLLPALVAFAVIPFGDVVEIGGRTIELQVAKLDVGVLFVLAMASLGVYGVVLGGWASNNRWSLLGGIRSRWGSRSSPSCSRTATWTSKPWCARRRRRRSTGGRSGESSTSRSA
jgi:NADH-quinone oxidoreductase subunit H